MIADTLDLMVFSGWGEFFTKRSKKYASTVFKAHPFMKMTVFIDYEAFEPMFNWDGRLQKDYGFGWAIPPLELVGNVRPSIYEPGKIHDPLKRFYMALLKERAPDLIPTFLDVSSRYYQKWESLGGGFSLRDEIEDMCATLVFQWYMHAHPDPADVRFLYKTIFLHQFLFLEKLNPWSRYYKSKPVYARLVKFMKGAPAFNELMTLAAVEGITDADIIAKQCIFLMGMNNFLGLNIFVRALIGELSIRPEICERIRAELDKEIGVPSASTLSMSAISRLDFLDKVVMETFRRHPPVFFIYGRAVQDFNLKSKTGTYAIPKGELLMGVIPLAQEDAELYPDPLTFNPDRFNDPKASEFLIWPHGHHNDEIKASSRICPGRDVAVTIAKLVAITLLAKYDWTFEDPKITWSRKRPTLAIAAPVGDLKVQSFSKRT